MTVRHPAHRRVLGVICVLVAASFACNLGSLRGPAQTPTPAQVEAPATSGDAVMLTSAVVGSQGGKITVAGSQGPLEGLEIDVPAGALANDTQWEVSYRPLASDALGEEVQVLTPLIRVENGGAHAAEIVTIRVPATVPADHFAMGFTYDPTRGVLEAIPTVGQDEHSLTLATRHFSDFTAASVPIAYLDSKPFETGFKPGVDFWHFDNYGSYINPEGFCSGMSLTAIWHYAKEKPVTGEPLWGQMDNYLGADFATPNFWQDDDTAIRLVAVAQNALKAQIGWKLPETWVERAGMTRDQQHYYSTAFALHMTKQPQVLDVYASGESSRHALVCYRKEGNQLWVVDPNYAGAAATIQIENGRFRPYRSADNALASTREELFSYDQIRFYGLSSIWDWDLLHELWLDAQSDRIGRFPVKATDWQGAWTPTYFPPYTVVAVERDAQGNESETPLDPMEVHETDQASLEVRLEAPAQFEGRPLQLRVRVYRFQDLGVTVGPPVPLEPGDNLLGFLVEGYTAGQTCSREDPGWCWVGFDWVTVRRLESDQPEQEPVETPGEAGDELNECNALDEVEVLVKPTSVDSDGKPSWVTGSNCKASVAFVNRNPEVQVRVLVRKVDDEDPDAGEWLNYNTQQVAPEEASYPHMLDKHWDQDGVVDNWSDFLEFKAFYTGAGYYHCNALADDPAAADLPTGTVEHPCRAFDPRALPGFSAADCACDSLAAPAVKADGQGSGYSCTYDWGHDAAGLNNIKLSVTRYESPEAAADAFAYHRDRVANAGAEAGVVTQALEESADSLTRADQQTNKNHVFYGAWWGHRVARYRQAVITLYLAAQDLGGAGEVMAALDTAQGCAEAAIDRYESACEALPIGCSP